MTVRADKPVKAKSNGNGRPHTMEQVGAATFSDLVRAHYHREEERNNGAGRLDEAETEFTKRLAHFEHEEGKLAAVYWSTKNASAIALTIGAPRREWNPITDTDAEVRLHRVTDWVTKDAEPIAELLHECDVLGIRVREVLRGTPQRIAMQWLYSVQEHALGFLERCDSPSEKVVATFVKEQRAELARIEKYYLRTGSKAGRIVYTSGMVAAAAAIVGVCAVVAGVMAATGHLKHSNAQFLLLSTSAGAVGALVSVLSRMSGGDDRFTVDFEVGRPLLRRLGLYKPFVGAVFGVATYFLLAGGLLPATTTDNRHRLYFYGIIAFLAGFSERFTGVIFGNVEQLVGGATAPAKQPAQDPTPES